MERMFYNAGDFNQPLNAWDVAPPRGRVLLARSTGCGPLLSSIDRRLIARTLATSAPTSPQVSSVTDMEGMFSNAWFFNQPLDAWDVAVPRGRILFL